MLNNKDQKNIKIDRAMREIDIIFSATVKKLEKLHQKKIMLIKYYRESGRQEEIEKIRQSLKSI
ncbi:MAG: hypothetical protein WCN88_03925 [Candidatus Falkowbacteria bacterium]